MQNPFLILNFQFQVNVMSKSRWPSSVIFLVELHTLINKVLHVDETPFVLELIENEFQRACGEYFPKRCY